MTWLVRQRKFDGEEVMQVRGGVMSRCILHGEKWVGGIEEIMDICWWGTGDAHCRGPSIHLFAFCRKWRQLDNQKDDGGFPTKTGILKSGVW